MHKDKNEVILMALVAVTELLLRADREGYAVGAFNANNIEIIQDCGGCREGELPGNV
jgi:fructose-bisphosphate aldolase, class II